MPPVIGWKPPDWVNPDQASVLDSWWEKAARLVGRIAGLDDPNTGVMGMMTAMEAPAAKTAQKVIRAFHGSPHDFDQFSMSKIGTGEGAQAYGHGLYFAENEGVAKAYRDNLAVDPRDRISQIAPHVLAEDPIRRNSTIIGLLDGSPGLDGLADDPETVQLIRTALEGQRLDGSVTDQALRAYNALDTKLPKATGKMYEVNIKADPDTFLDWDKPLKEQPEAVKQALQKAWLAHPEDHANQTGRQIYNAAEHEASLRAVDAAGAQGVYRGGDVGPLAAKVLKDAGVPGIRYLDQGSRVTAGVNEFGGKWFTKGSSTPYATKAEAEAAAEAAGNVSRNYVVFDDSLIEIARKYGIPLAVLQEALQRQQQSSRGENLGGS